VHVACNLSFIVKNEGVFKVIVSNVHFKSGGISGTELDKDTDFLFVFYLRYNKIKFVCLSVSSNRPQFPSDLNQTWHAASPSFVFKRKSVK